MEEWNVMLKPLVIYRIDSIIVGFLLAWIYHYYKNYLEKIKFYIFIVALHVMFIQFVVLNAIGVEIVTHPTYFIVFHLLIASITIACVMPMFIFWNTNRSTLCTKTFTFISKTSYSIYLLHYSILSVLFKFLLLNIEVQLPKSIVIVVYLATTVISSFLLYSYVEKPFMKLRK
jgi:peptidoglycan/LPS O-acetylase OafA/YrhL